MKQPIENTILQLLRALQEPNPALDLNTLLARGYSDGGLGHVYGKKEARFIFDALAENKPDAMSWLRVLAGSIEAGSAIVRTIDNRVVAEVSCHQNKSKAALCYAVAYYYGDKSALLQLYRLLIDERASQSLIDTVKRMVLDRQQQLVSELPVVEEALAKQRYVKRIYLAPQQSDRAQQLHWLMAADKKKDKENPKEQVVIHWDQAGWDERLQEACKNVSGPVKVTLRGHCNDDLEELYGFSNADSPKIAVATMRAALLSAFTGNPALGFITVSILSCNAGALKHSFALGIASAMQSRGLNFKLTAPLAPIAVMQNGEIKSRTISELTTIDAERKRIHELFSRLLSSKKKGVVATVKGALNSTTIQEEFDRLLAHAEKPQMTDDAFLAAKKAFFTRFEEYYSASTHGLRDSLDSFRTLFHQEPTYVLNQPGSAVSFFSKPSGLTAKSSEPKQVVSTDAMQSELVQIADVLLMQPKTYSFC